MPRQRRVGIVAVERHGEVDRQQLLVDAERVVQDAEAVADVEVDAIARERVASRRCRSRPTSANSVPAEAAHGGEVQQVPVEAGPVVVAQLEAADRARPRQQLVGAVAAQRQRAARASSAARTAGCRRTSRCLRRPSPARARAPARTAAAAPRRPRPATADRPCRARSACTRRRRGRRPRARDRTGSRACRGPGRGAPPTRQPLCGISPRLSPNVGFRRAPATPAISTLVRLLRSACAAEAVAGADGETDLAGLGVKRLELDAVAQVVLRLGEHADGEVQRRLRDVEQRARALRRAAASAAACGCPCADRRRRAAMPTRGLDQPVARIDLDAARAPPAGRPRTGAPAGSSSQSSVRSPPSRSVTLTSTGSRTASPSRRTSMRHVRSAAGGRRDPHRLQPVVDASARVPATAPRTSRGPRRTPRRPRARSGTRST